MKRKGIIGVVIAALICVCIALNCKIVDPADYTGAWYVNVNEKVSRALMNF